MREQLDNVHCRSHYTRNERLPAYCLFHTGSLRSEYIPIIYSQSARDGGSLRSHWVAIWRARPHARLAIPLPLRLRLLYSSLSFYLFPRLWDSGTPSPHSSITPIHLSGCIRRLNRPVFFFFCESFDLNLFRGFLKSGDLEIRQTATNIRMKYEEKAQQRIS